MIGMNRKILLVLLLVLFLSCIGLYAKNQCQVVWVYPDNLNRGQEMEKLDSCLRSSGLVSQSLLLDISTQRITIGQLTDSLHSFLEHQVHQQSEGIILCSVGDCSYVAMQEAQNNNKIKMLITLSGVFLPGDDYVYNKYSLLENKRIQDSCTVSLKKMDKLKDIFNMIQRIREGKAGVKSTPKDPFVLGCWMFLSSNLGKSVVRFDTRQVLPRLHCPCFAIYSEKDVSWDFLSHQEFLQKQLNRTPVLYETLGPMQYSGKLLHPKNLNILFKRIMNLLKMSSDD